MGACSFKRVGWALVSFPRLLDTVGFAFLNPLAKFCGCKVVSYVHYPTISSDMLGKVTRGEADFNNSAAISKSAVLTTAKLL